MKEDLSKQNQKQQEPNMRELSFKMSNKSKLIKNFQERKAVIAQLINL